MLNFFDQKLKDETSVVNLEDKVEILSSLTEIIKIMGSSYVASVKHKILSTLNTGLNIKGVPKKVLVSTWDAFITTIDVSALNPILGQVVACLLQLPMVEEEDKSVKKLYKYLLEEHKKDLKASFPQLNFIPEGLEPVSKIVRKENGIGPGTEFKVILKLGKIFLIFFKLSMIPFFCILLLIVTNSLSNENNNVKIFTLEKILCLLKLNQGKLQGLVLSNEETDPFITFLILKLMECCRSSDTKVSSLAGACLGKIGAVDPGRLHLVEDLNQGTFKTHLSVLEEDFIVDLIHVLVKAFLSFFNSGAADSCSFSIQEILRAYEITEKSGGRVWQKLPESTREVLVPLLSSHYSVENETLEKFALPIYKHSEDFSKWISSWSSYLMTKITQAQMLKIFHACKPVIKKDSSCAQFLLPYILVCVICNGSNKDREEIVSEVEAIIGNEEQVSNQVSTLNGSILSEQRAHSVSQDLGWMAKQTVFAVLDHMNKWLARKYAQLQESKPRGRGAAANRDVEPKDQDFESVRSFVKAIKQHNLAMASFECRAYARSLMHLEAHLREKSEDMPHFLTKLQQVYGALDEPDYLFGLQDIRKQSPSLEELIHHHQVTGNFQDALACYSSLGRENKESLELQSGMLR